MHVELVRVLRTPSSERFLTRVGGNDAGALEIHYLTTGVVQATFIIFEGGGIDEERIPEYLTYIDEVLLPDVSLDDKKLSFTVVVGRVLGAYEASSTG